MTLEEKAALLSGKGEWQTWDFDRLGIPSLPATCFPTAATMANSWDTSLGEEIGRALSC